MQMQLGWLLSQNKFVMKKGQQELRRLKSETKFFRNNCSEELLEWGPYIVRVAIKKLLAVFIIRLLQQNTYVCDNTLCPNKAQILLVNTWSSTTDLLTARASSIHNWIKQEKPLQADASDRSSLFLYVNQVTSEDFQNQYLRHLWAKKCWRQIFNCFISTLDFIQRSTPMCKAVMSMFLFTNKDSQLMSEEILQIQAKLLSCVLAQLSRNQSIYLLWKVSLYKCYTFHRRIILIKTF